MLTLMWLKINYNLWKMVWVKRLVNLKIKLKGFKIIKEVKINNSIRIIKF